MGGARMVIYLISGHGGGGGLHCVLCLNMNMCVLWWATTNDMLAWKPPTRFDIVACFDASRVHDGTLTIPSRQCALPTVMCSCLWTPPPPPSRRQALRNVDKSKVKNASESQPPPRESHVEGVDFSC